MLCGWIMWGAVALNLMSLCVGVWRGVREKRDYMALKRQYKHYVERLETVMQQYEGMD